MRDGGKGERGEGRVEKKNKQQLRIRIGYEGGI